MTWLLLTFAAVFSRAIYGVFSKMMSNKVPVSASAQSLLLQLTAIPLTLAVSPMLGGLSTQGIGGHWPVILLMMASIGAGNILYFKGLQHLGAGLAQIAFSSIILWGALMSVIFLDSAFSWIQLGGASLLITAIVIAQYDGKRSINVGVIYILAAAASFAAFQVASADLSTALTGGTYLVLSYAGPALVTLLLVARNLNRELTALQGQVRKSITTVLPATITTVSYYAFAFFAYREAPDAGVVVILLTTQTILAVLLAMAILKERHNVKRTASAAVLAVVAAIAIKA